MNNSKRHTIATVPQQTEEAQLKAGALQSAIFNSANFSSIATDAKGVIQIFNVGAERMLGYAAAEVLNRITPADISDPQEVIARAQALSVELETPITPGFEALVFKASRGIEDIYELTYIRKDGSRFPAVVSVTALRDAQDAIIGYLLIGTDNTARKQVEAERQHLLEIQEETNKQLQQANVTLRDSEEKLAVTLNSIGDAVIATDAEARVTLPESPCRTAHRLDAGGSQRPPGGRDFSHHQQGNPSTRHYPGHGNPGAWHDTGPGQPHRPDCTRWQRVRYRRQLRADSRPRRSGGRRRAGVPRCHRGICSAAGLARQCRADPDDTQYRGGRHHHPPCPAAASSRPSTRPPSRCLAIPPRN